MDVKVDGLWVASMAHVGTVEWSDRYGDGPCGPDQVSFTVALDGSDDSSWLRLGRTVEVFDTGVKVFGGVVSEVGRDFPRTVHAKGWPRTVEGESTVVGHRYGRTVDNAPFTPTDPTSVSWMLDATTLEIGVADDGLYTAIVYTYVDSLDTEGNPVTATGGPIVDAAAVALYGTVTYEMDLTSAGLMTGADALALAEAQLAEFTVPQLLSRVACTEQILFTPGGQPAHLPSIRAGQMVELFNVPNSLGGIQHELNQRIIIGESTHSADSPGEVAIAPTRLAVRNLADALKQAARS